MCRQQTTLKKKRQNTKTYGVRKLRQRSLSTLCNKLGGNGCYLIRLGVLFIIGGQIGLPKNVFKHQVTSEIYNKFKGISVKLYKPFVSLTINIKTNFFKVIGV